MNSTDEVMVRQTGKKMVRQAGKMIVLQADGKSWSGEKHQNNTERGD